jgi:hypothetical protein
MLGKLFPTNQSPMEAFTMKRLALAVALLWLFLASAGEARSDGPIKLLWVTSDALTWMEPASKPSWPDRMNNRYCLGCHCEQDLLDQPK